MTSQLAKLSEVLERIKNGSGFTEMKQKENELS
jgi:hypothetical protein